MARASVAGSSLDDIVGIVWLLCKIVWLGISRC